MALFNAFPWTNFHELNLDWLVKKVKEIDAAFPEGLIGISKGGTGADTAAGARENLEIAGDTVPFTSAIPGQSISDYVGDIQTTIANLSDALAENLNYKIYRSVTSLPNITAGTATILGCWYAMSPGEILIAPHTDFAPAEIPASYGVVFMVRAAATNGMVRYFGNRSYEMPLVSNVPDGVWRQLRQNSDIVPVESGGTGANNAEDARANLGIDFSGTVLSVCNQGADSAGNVALKYTDLVNNYESVVDLGLPSSGTTIAAIWNLLPVNSRMLFPASQTSNAPANNDGGYIEIVKTADSGYIVYRSKTDSPGDARMYLGTGGAPSGTWESGAAEDDTGWINCMASGISGTLQCRVKNGIFYLQGNAIGYSANANSDKIIGHIPASIVWPSGTFNFLARTGYTLGQGWINASGEIHSLFNIANPTLIAVFLSAPL